MADNGIKIPVSLVPNEDSTKKAGEQIGKQLTDTLKETTKIDLSGTARRSAITAKNEFAKYNDIRNKIAKLRGTSEILPEQADAYKTAISNVAKYSKELDRLTASQAKAEVSYQKLAKTLDDKAEARKQKEIEKLDKAYENAGRIASQYDAERNRLITKYKGEHGISDSDVAIKRLQETSKSYNKAIEEHQRYTNIMADIEQKRNQIDEKSISDFKTDAEISKLKEAEQAYKNYGDKITEVTEKISANKEVIKDATFVKYEDTDEAARDLRNLEDALNKTKLAYTQLQAELRKPIIQRNTEIFKAISRAVQDTTKHISQLTNQLMRLAGATLKNGVTKLSSSVRGLGTDSQFTDKSFKKAIKTFIKYGFGVRSFFYLFRKIRTAIVNVFTELGKENYGEAGKSVNALADSLNYLKNSWVAAFAPILNFVTPALTTLMDSLAGAVNMLAAFFSMLTGKQIYMKAIKQTGTLAKETKKGAGAQKEWNNELYDFDELNRQKDDTSSGGDGGGGIAFEEVPIGTALTGWIADWIKRLREAIKMEEFYKIGQLLAEGLNHALNKLDKWINETFRPWGVKWAKNIADIVNGFFETWYLWDTMGKTISDGIAAVLDIISTFLENVNFESIGKAFGILLNRIFANQGMWDEIARFVSTKFNSMLKLIDGFLEETLTKVGGWGNTLWQTIVKVVRNIDWNLLINDVVNGVQWIINFLNGFLSDEATWNEVRTTVSNTINAIITQINLDDLGKSINELITRIMEFLGTIDWYQLGYKVGQLLGEINWFYILATVGEIIVESLWGAINGFLSTSQGQATLATGILLGLLMIALKAGLILLKAKIIELVKLYFVGSVTAPLIGGGAEVEAAGSSIVTALQGIGAKMATALQTAAPIIGQAALAVIDAALIAYDVTKIDEANNTYLEAEATHRSEQETALEAYRQLYETKGKEVADEWAKTAYDIDTTNMSLDEAQNEIVSKIDTLWNGVPQNLWEGFSQGWNSYFGAEGGGLFRLITDAFGEKGFIGWVKHILGIHSPSKVMEDIGKNIIDGLWAGISKSIGTFSINVSGMLDGIKKLFSDSEEETVKSTKINYETLRDTAETKMNSVKANIKENTDKIKEKVKSSWGNAKESTVTNWNEINRTTNTVWNAVNSLVSSVLNSLSNIIPTTTNLIATTITTTWTNLQTATVIAWNYMSSAVISLWNGLRAMIASVDFTSIGSGMVNGISSGISSVWESLRDSFMDKIQSLIDSAKRLLDIHSPSKVFAEIGKDTALGLAKGITDEHAPIDATRDMIEEMTDVNTNINQLPNSLDNALAKLTVLADRFASINNSLQRMANIPIPAVAMGGVAPSSALSQNVRNDTTDIVGAIRSALNESTLNNQSGSSQGQPIKIYINGRELFNVIVDENNSAIIRTGTSPLVR